MAKTKQPELGDRILHKEPYFNRENEGVVIQLLGMQFVYRTAKDMLDIVCLEKLDLLRGQI